MIKSILKKKLYYGDINDVEKKRPEDLKRLPSRQSNTNFCNVDFDYYGNSREVFKLCVT